MSTARALRRTTGTLSRLARRPNHIIYTQPTLLQRIVPTATANRFLSTTPALRIGLTEASDNKESEPAKESEPHDAHPTAPTPLSDEEYHERSDMYLESLLLRLEAAAEEGKGGLDVEFAVSIPKKKGNAYHLPPPPPIPFPHCLNARATESR